MSIPINSDKITTWAALQNYWKSEITQKSKDQWGRHGRNSVCPISRVCIFLSEMYKCALVVSDRNHIFRTIANYRNSTVHNRGPNKARHGRRKLVCLICLLWIFLFEYTNVLRWILIRFTSQAPLQTTGIQLCKRARWNAAHMEKENWKKIISLSNLSHMYLHAWNYKCALLDSNKIHSSSCVAKLLDLQNCKRARRIGQSPDNGSRKLVCPIYLICIILFDCTNFVCSFLQTKLHLTRSSVLQRNSSF